MSILLIDVLTYLTNSMQEVFDLVGLSNKPRMQWIRHQLLPALDVVAEFAVRSVYYSIASVWILLRIWWLDPVEDVLWAAMISVWFAFAFAAHMQLTFTWTAPQLLALIRKQTKRGD